MDHHFDKACYKLQTLCIQPLKNLHAYKKKQFLSCLSRFRPQSTAESRDRFFVRLSTAKPIMNAQKEFTQQQKEFNLPQIHSGNSRHVLETKKGAAGLNDQLNAGEHFLALSLSHTTWSSCQSLQLIFDF